MDVLGERKNDVLPSGRGAEPPRSLDEIDALPAHELSVAASSPDPLSLSRAWPFPS